MATKLRITLSLLFTLVVALSGLSAPPSLGYADAYGSTTVVSTTGARVPINLYTSSGKLHGTFNESHFITSDGSHAYCVNAAAEFRTGTFTSHDPLDYMSQKALTECALAQYYIAEVDTVIPNQYRYAVTQCWIWSFLNSDGCAPSEMHDITGYVISGYDATASWNAFLSWLGSHEDEFVGHGIYWVNGEHQPVCQFWTSKAVGSIELMKVSGNPSITDGNGCYDLAGATYEVRNEAGSVVATLVTDHEGHATASNLPAGSYTLSETSPARGYAINTQTINVTVVAEQTSAVRTSDYPQSCPADVWAYKVDADTDDGTPQGAASLEGAEFTVRYYATTTGYDPAKPDRVWTIRTDANGHASVGNEDLISGDALFRAFGSQAVIPVGTIAIQETKAPEGYQVDSTIHERIISPNNEGIEAIRAFDAPTIREHVQRGDYHFSKHVLPAMTPLAHVPFSITSTTTGESHIAVTDANGYLATSTSKNAHSLRTNANDVALLDNGTIDEQALDESAGIWFSGRVDKTTAPIDTLGALPYDTYEIRELPCTANAGLKLAQWTIVVSSDGCDIDGGTINNVPAPHIATTLTSNGANHVAEARQTVELTDTVSYGGLEPGKTYTLSGELHLVAPDGLNTDIITSVEHSFVPSNESGDEAVTFTLDASGLAGRTVVAYEKLTQDGEVIAEHADPTDAEQTVHFPTIHTTLTGPEGAKTVCADGGLMLTDTVVYENLVPEKTYTVSGTLHVKDDEGNDRGALLDENGAPVTVSQDFVAQEPSDTVEVTFYFPGEWAAGKQVVAFETLGFDDEIIATHSDIADANQTMAFASIGTTAVNAGDGTHTAEPTNPVTIVDTIQYRGLVPGQVYTAQGTLMDADTGKALITGDIPVTAQVDFVPEGPEGSIDVTFTFDATNLDGATLVVFEDLRQGDVLVARHADLEDADQTVAIVGQPMPSHGEVFAKAGSIFLRYWWLFAALASAAIVGIVVGLRQSGGRSHPGSGPR